MKHLYFSPERDGFYGAYYPLRTPSHKAMILMLGDNVDDALALAGVRWLHEQQIAVLAMAPAKKDYGHHNLPLERFGTALRWLKVRGHKQIGIFGISTTGMLALIAASYYPEISLTIAASPSDFVMEGFYRGHRDGATEWPGDGESTVCWQGNPLPYLPFAHRHPAFAQCMKENARATHNLVASRALFDDAERQHPLREEACIKIERICGKIVCIGAEDDAMWDTCRYIRRMQTRLAEHPHTCTLEALLYTHGTHFVLPQSMVQNLLPVGSSFFIGLCFQAGRQHPGLCKTTRLDIDQHLRRVLAQW